MTTSATSTSNEKISQISKGELAHAISRNQHQVHDMLLRIFKESGKTQKELATLTGIDESVISRLRRRPRNIELDTLSRLVYAACGAYVEFDLVRPGVNQKSAATANRAFVLSAQDETIFQSKFGLHIVSSSDIPRYGSIKTGSIVAMELSDA